MDVVVRSTQRIWWCIWGNLLFACAIPGAMLSAVYFGKAEYPKLVLPGAGIVFVCPLRISAYTYVWYRWAKKRENAAFRTMQRRGEEELERDRSRVTLRSPKYLVNNGGQ